MIHTRDLFFEAAEERFKAVGSKMSHGLILKIVGRLLHAALISPSFLTKVMIN